MLFTVLMTVSILDPHICEEMEANILVRRRKIWGGFIFGLNWSGLEFGARLVTTSGVQLTYVFTAEYSKSNTQGRKSEPSVSTD